MRAYALSHLSDAALLAGLSALVVQDRATTAALLAHIAEVDERRLYVPAGYASMHAYCVGELRFSEGAAYKRIQAARAAQQFPVLFTAVADGALHLTAVRLLAPHLTADNLDELVTAAAHRRASEIEHLLARRFVLQLTIGQATHDKLRHATELLSHAVPSGDLARVVDRALDALISQLARRKHAATDRPCARGGCQEPSADGAAGLAHDAPHAAANAAPHDTTRPRRRSRHIPAHVRRAVWQRDEGRCTFEGNSGHRCNTHSQHEFDHVHPVARGGLATVDGVRLRCRAHNQYEAERIFGAEFMQAKRDEARRSSAATGACAGPPVTLAPS